MKYLNVGCGSQYIKLPNWTNIDFISNDKYVIAHNLLKGIPFKDHSFDYLYHSHVLEHFSKDDGVLFMRECFRVLKPNGIIRIAIPDLETIARNYIFWLEKGISNLDDDLIKANYDWMLLEMYDQTVRNSSGGQMGKYLIQKELINEQFIYDRIGEEGRVYRQNNLISEKATDVNFNLVVLIKQILRKIKKISNRSFFTSNYSKIGCFRLGGEIHQWMYDRYSLTKLLTDIGFSEVVIKDSFESSIVDWEKYNLDIKNGIARKPDSMYIEGRKK